MSADTGSILNQAITGSWLYPAACAYGEDSTYPCLMYDLSSG